MIKKFNQYVDNAPEGKWAAFSPAKYVLVIENEIAPYYWSEKFTDAILSYAIPIYYGSPNISDYFPKGSFISFDITSENAIADLMTIINSDYYEQNLVNLLEYLESN